VRRPRIWILAGAALTVLVLLLLGLSRPGFLLDLSSAENGRTLLSSGSLAPGATASAKLTLTNSGAVPITYYLELQSRSSGNGLTLNVQDLQSHRQLYSGVIPRSPVRLGDLWLPGASAHLQVSLSSHPGAQTSSYPIDFRFVWSAQPAQIWTFNPAPLVLLVLLLLTLAYLLTRSRDPSRRRLGATFGLATLLVLLLLLAPAQAATLGALNTQVVNPPDQGFVGALVLNQRNQSSNCLAFSAGTGGNASCDKVFQFVNQGPGALQEVHLSLSNPGTIPASRLDMWASQCATGNAPGVLNHGTADVCSLLKLTLHDDTHDRCFFPTQAAGACSVTPTGTLADFSRLYSPTSPLQLDVAGLGAGIDYTFGLSLPRSISNDAQGRVPVLNFTWQVTQ